MASAIAAISLFATLEFALISGASAQLPVEEEPIATAPVSASANLKANAPEETGPALPTLIEMSDATAVRSMDMLMVSVMVQQVEKARAPKGAKKIAAEIAKEKYGWGSYQFSCLNSLWTRESNWNYRARNPRTHKHFLQQRWTSLLPIGGPIQLPRSVGDFITSMFATKHRARRSLNSSARVTTKN
jgi:hypothetical protein